jgi:hypothetical protein
LKLDVNPRNWIKVCIFLDEDGKAFLIDIREGLSLCGLAVPAHSPAVTEY